MSIMSVSLFMLSCGGEPSVAEKEANLVSLVLLPESKGKFRGVDLGDAYLDVRNKLDGKAVADADSVLEYHHEIPWRKDENKLVVYYTFDSFGLFEIQADLFLDDKAKTDEAFRLFQAHFDTLYGTPECTGQFCRWTTYSRSNNMVEVTLSNESFDMDHPFVSINFLEPLSNEI